MNHLLELIQLKVPAQVISLYISSCNRKKLKEQLLANDCDAIRYASFNGHLQIVQELLKAGHVKKQLSASNCAAIRYASYRGHLQIVQELLKAGLVKEQLLAYNCAVIRWASSHGYLQVVQELKQLHKEYNIELPEGIL